MAVEGTSASSGGAKKGTIKVKHGAWTRDFESGKTVREYKEKMSQMTNIPQGAQAYSGTRLLSDDDIVEEGMSLEIVKKSGEKGS